MSGCITKTEVRNNKAQIIHDFGLHVYLACLLAKTTDTFLGILVQQEAL